MPDKDGVTQTLEQIQVSGTVQIIDKDGNLKSEMEIVSLEIAEGIENDATG